MTLQVMVANIEPHAFADAAQAAGLSVTVWESWGAGSWGVERGVTALFAAQDPARVASFVTSLLRERGESAALVIWRGEALLWHAGGTVEPLEEP